MRYARILSAFGMLTAGCAAETGVSSTWTLASDYDLRGITQTARDPAIQASLDYAHDSGWYIGAWASNLDYCAPGASGCVDADYELDLYTGFSSAIGENGPIWELGLIYYTYEESDYDYRELYVALGKDWLKAKLSYSDDFGGDITAGHTPAVYIDASATVPLPHDFSLLGHVGYSFGDYWDGLENTGAGNPYVDYSVGIGYTAGHFKLALKWVDGSDLRPADGTPHDVLSS